MIVSSALTSDGSFRRDLVIDSLDTSILEHAKSIFEAYKKCGTISAESIGSDSWILTDERIRVSLSFSFNEFLYLRYGEKWLHCDPALLKQYMKAFILMKMGSLGLGSLCSLTRSLNKLMSAEDPIRFSPKSSSGSFIAEFLRLLPGSYESREKAAVRFASLPDTSNGSGDQRLLADFTAYLRFHDCMESAWGTASDSDRLFLFPLWLWWHLTMILPLRPTEFTLTPYDCVYAHDGCHLIRIRRTCLKGGSEKFSYTVDGDFIIAEYEIPEYIVHEIQWYKDALKDRGYKAGRYLFSVDYYYDYVHTPSCNRANNSYRYGNLKRSLRFFYNHFADQDPAEPRLHLGDTRHLAMINLIISGGSPVICRELAGHDRIDISSHYYSNISSLVECATYEFYRKSIKSFADPPSGSAHYALEIPHEKVRMNDGWCCSQEYISHSVRDCIRSISESGQIGSCDDCRYFRPDRPGIRFHFEDTDFNKERVKADSWFLMYMTESVRLGGASSGDLYRALLRLQNSCKNYMDSILNDLRRKEAGSNGKTTKK